jgi:hypothetical protein
VAGKVKRAALVSRMDKKVSVSVGDEDDMAGFTQRVLMSLVLDVTYLAKNVERVKVQVMALARENGVPIPPDDD